MPATATTTRALRKRAAPMPTTPSAKRTGRPAKRVKVVHSDSESEPESSDDDASDYDDLDDDKENVAAPVTPRSQRAAARRKAELTTTPRRRVLSANTKTTPSKSASPTKGAAKKIASLALGNSTNAPDSDTSVSSDDSNPFVATPDTSLELDAPPSPTKKERDLTPFARARAALRADRSSTPLTGRDAERTELLAYLRGSSPRSLYISGTPGTGKTALIREVLGAYCETDDAASNDDEVKKVYVNCVGRKEEHVWDLILDSMRTSDPTRSPKKKKADDGRVTFERLLSASDSKCILVLDEIDHLSPSSGVLASVFALPASHPSLRVVAISNSHTLAARSRDVATVHFAPYDAKAMGDIARARLGSASSIVVPAAITLSAARTAGVTGDVRALVALILRALDVAERAGRPAVGPADVLEAFKSLKLQKPAQPAAAAVQTTASGPAAGLALQPKLALLALFVAKKRLAAGLGLGLMPSSSSFGFATPSSPTKRSPSKMQRSSSFSTSPSKRAGGMSRTASFGSAVDTNALHAFYAAVVARSSPLAPVGRTEFVDVLAVLEGCGAASGALEVAEGVRVEDVLAGEGAEEGLLRALWDKEVRRCDREAAERAPPVAKDDEMDL